MTSDDIATWAHAAVVDGGLGLDEAVPVIPIDQVEDADVTGQALFVAATGGPGYMLEGASDVRTLQFRCQGEQGNLGDAYRLGETFALSVDALMFAATNSRPVIGGRQVILISRIGGPPAYLLTRNRQAHFTASYAFEIATS